MFFEGLFDVCELGSCFILFVVDFEDFVFLVDVLGFWWVIFGIFILFLDVGWFSVFGFDLLIVDYDGVLSWGVFI